MTKVGQGDQERKAFKIGDSVAVTIPAQLMKYYPIREGDIAIPRVPNVEPLGAELRHFVAVASGAEQSRTPAASGVAIVRILEAASQSLASNGSTVSLKSIHTG